MKALIKIAPLLFVTTLMAAAQEQEESLACPRAVVVIDGPQSLRSSARVIENSAKIGGGFQFQGALSRSHEAKSLGTMSWRHITRTESGDIYLVVFKRPDGSREATSLLFDGHSDVSWRRGDWRLTITQEPPNKRTTGQAGAVPRRV